MSRLSMVYDGQCADKLTSDELINAILRQYGIAVEDNIIKAMNEAFRCGFLRGESYGREIAECK